MYQTLNINLDKKLIHYSSSNNEWINSADDKGATLPRFAAPISIS